MSNRLLPLAGLLALLLLLGGTSLLGCRATAFYERERLSHRSMQLADDTGVAYLRGKTEAAREGGFGGFGSATAGGCGCQ